MNIQEAKEEITHTLRAYLHKDAMGSYTFPLVRQRPILLIGPPGIGKTAVMEQIARECQVGLVSYTMTHHTRQSAIGLPKLVEKNYGGMKLTVTEYTMSEIVASVYDCMERTGKKRGYFLSMRLTVFLRHWLRRCCSCCRTSSLEAIGSRMAGFS